MVLKMYLVVLTQSFFIISFGRPTEPHLNYMFEVFVSLGHLDTVIFSI